HGSKVIAFPASVAHLEGMGLVPSVSVVDIKDRGDLPRFVGPAIYLAVKGRSLYPGMTGKGWVRVAASHLDEYDKVAVLRDLSGQMTDAMAAAGERIAGLYAEALPKYRLA